MKIIMKKTHFCLILLKFSKKNLGFWKRESKTRKKSRFSRHFAQSFFAKMLRTVQITWKVYFGEQKRRQKEAKWRQKEEKTGKRF